MNVSAPFIRRPVATTLLTLAIVLAGCFAFFKLPVAPLPPLEVPVVAVEASMPGASPELMASAVATPLERHLSAIADVTEMSSESRTGTTSIVLLFGFGRNLDGAARDVQAAINAARADLPAAMSGNPQYYKDDKAGGPILYVSLTSATLSPERIYDFASALLEQTLSSVRGVGKAWIFGSSKPAVRVELNPDALSKYGVGLEDVRAALAAANANSPKGAIEVGEKRLQIYANDQARRAADYRGLVIAYRNGLAVKLSDVAEVEDSVETLRTMATTNGVASVVAKVYRRPDANIVATVDRIKARLPQLRAALPAGVDLTLLSDRTVEIRASLRDLERTLLIAGALVILVVFAFLRSLRATLIPAVVVPVSLIGTFTVMFLLGYSLNNLSLLALTIVTGLVVDDAIIVLENISRHIETGMTRIEAALRGAREVGFTVLSMTLSLIAIFIPFLLAGGIVGRFFNEFAMTFTVAILISLAASLATAPMLCALMLKAPSRHMPGRLSLALDHAYQAMLRAYDHTLSAALRHPRAMLLILFVMIGLNFYLFAIVPKGLLPQQDASRIFGLVEADPGATFEATRRKLVEASAIIQADPAVESLISAAEASLSFGSIYLDLKPMAQRKESSDAVKRRLSQSVNDANGASISFISLGDLPDFSFNPEANRGQYQYKLQGDNIAELRIWSHRLTDALKHVPEILDPSSAQNGGGLETNLVIDRATASRLGITASQIDTTLYDAFGERQASTISAPLNQYHVVMEVAPRYRQTPDTLDKIYISTSGGVAGGVQSTNAPAGTVSRGTAQATRSNAAAIASDAARNRNLNALANTGRGPASTGAAVSTKQETMIPLSAIARFEQGSAPVSVDHNGRFVSATIFFNLPPKIPLSEAMAAIEQTAAEIHMPATIHAGFSGAAKIFQQMLVKELILIGAALATIYVVLGVLYESFLHPLTILSTLPSAGVGALLALIACGGEFSIIAFIGVILLIGIVKKNAIMMIDVAIQSERNEGLSPRDAIHQACLLRFRPIMMTTFAALFGALPLALGLGEGAELRQPLGIAIIGGLIVSQALTLYTTPVVYLYLDRLRHRRKQPCDNA
ncbi:efflux RND transporter permease subunit [Methylocapsa acidiphila]|uniref:efflux RND transporter permease subunit n=1 Tax=Methylocapsa acidiphila TaxID=133552 RepID=UPI000428538B|nr:efflux RND transporter permease subunit [Methylocapsa acidiphila]